MYNFTYHRPTTVRQALNLLAKNEDAKLLAGGHTLLPTMKLRLASPKHIVDMSRIEGLSAIEASARALVVGAMTRHVEVETSPVVRENLPGARRSCQQDRRPGGAPHGHDWWLGRQQRPLRRLSGGLPGPRRYHRHQQAPDRSRRVLQGAVRNRARGRRDHHQGAVPAGEEGGAIRNSPTLRRAMRSSAYSCRSAVRKSASRSPAPAAAACSG